MSWINASLYGIYNDNKTIAIALLGKVKRNAIYVLKQVANALFFSGITIIGTIFVPHQVAGQISILNV